MGFGVCAEGTVEGSWGDRDGLGTLLAIFRGGDFRVFGESMGSGIYAFGRSLAWLMGSMGV